MTLGGFTAWACRDLVVAVTGRAASAVWSSGRAGASRTHRVVVESGRAVETPSGSAPSTNRIS
ncbi:hypothetical protein [Saccharomonospora saliphila]|uniref:hypothetical protein n=1 Tax=Saccharomonospora saliphila TaxID=369829 RepID=UPI001E32F065|nr:hypothetical protein [Saccharomonospora saliphila]